MYCSCGGIVAGAAGNQRAADVGLALEDADRRVEIPAGPVKTRRRRHLDVGCGAWLRPVGNIGPLRADELRRGKQRGGYEEDSVGLFHDGVARRM